jgi:hypothetical protein
MNKELMLDPKEKELYDKFCKKNYIPIFSQPWWLDAVCGSENWGVHVLEKSGQFLGAMPYYIESRNGYEIITKAHHSQNNGIIMSYLPNMKYVAKLDRQEEVINEMCNYIEKLGVDKYEQQYHYSFTNCLPFKWRGYNEMIRYTYVIDDTSDMEKIIADFKYIVRNQIKKAEKIVTIKEGMDIEKFYEINKLSYDRQNIDVPFSFKLLKRIEDACVVHDCRKILYSVDEEGNVHSVAYLVWDDESLYFLINGIDNEYMFSQSNSLLIRESIRVAHEHGKKFDFEGSVLQPIEHIFRGFGTEQKMYFRIYKTFNKDMDEQLVNSWSKNNDVF